ncbi:hypothetical protein BD770DRAFT_446721 [Pilaira anomala]|nr:hypothetical protein BD770DRAFT_446721 [Pilaira anomala]
MVEIESPPSFPRRKKKDKIPDIPFDTTNLLDTSIIDKPFFKNPVSRSSLNSSVNENTNSRDLNDKRITEEEVKLIQPDGPSYRAANIKNLKTLSKHPAFVVDAYLTYNPPTLKEMGLMLENLREASRETKPLSIYQEEFLYRKPKTNDFVRSKLPEEYFGNLKKLSFDRLDIYHHDLYRIIRHFDSFNSSNNKKRAEHLLSKSGRRPYRPILRRCDSAVRENTDATISDDETEYSR